LPCRKRDLLEHFSHGGWLCAGHWFGGAELVLLQELYALNKRKLLNEHYKFNGIEILPAVEAAREIDSWVNGGVIAKALRALKAK
jgi:hypothetical protein